MSEKKVIESVKKFREEICPSDLEEKVMNIVHKYKKIVERRMKECDREKDAEKIGSIVSDTMSQITYEFECLSPIYDAYEVRFYTQYVIKSIKKLVFSWCGIEI